MTCFLLFIAGHWAGDSWACVPEVVLGSMDLILSRFPGCSGSAKGRSRPMCDITGLCAYSQWMVGLPNNSGSFSAYCKMDFVFH